MESKAALFLVSLCDVAYARLRYSVEHASAQTGPLAKTSVLKLNTFRFPELKKKKKKYFAMAQGMFLQR